MLGIPLIIALLFSHNQVPNSEYNPNYGKYGWKDYFEENIQLSKIANSILSYNSKAKSLEHITIKAPNEFFCIDTLENYKGFVYANKNSLTYPIIKSKIQIPFDTYFTFDESTRNRRFNILSREKFDSQLTAVLFTRNMTEISDIENNRLYLPLIPPGDKLKFFEVPIKIIDLVELKEENLPRYFSVDFFLFTNSGISYLEDNFKSISPIESKGGSILTKSICNSIKLRLVMRNEHLLDSKK